MDIMHLVTNTDELNLHLKSTLQDLPLWRVKIEIERFGDDLKKLFEQEPLLPGVILTKNQYYVGMISRQRFFEYMSRPYSSSLFSKRPIEMLYNMLQPEVFILDEDTLILEATQKALKRSSELVYEPILIKAEFGRYGLLDFHQLLLVHSQIHVLTLTQLQQAEEESKIANTNLRHLEHNYTRLVQSEKMAALGQLVAGIAHEINNPVNFIAANLVHANQYSQELLKLISLYQQHYPHPVPDIETIINQIELDFLTIDFPDMLASMKLGAERIRSIVYSLRNFSRLDEAKKKLVDIHEGIDNTLLILQNRLKLHRSGEDITIIKEYSNLPLIECYASQLNQVFMHILNNAIDAIEQRRNILSKEKLSTPTIQICTEISETNYLVICIADNGVGMTEEVNKRIFDPFFTTKPVGKGTGMGLSISYQIIVEEHGGELHCISTPEKGTEFIIKIPMRQ